MEINNNISLYLHKCEDNGDNNDTGSQRENKISQSARTVTSCFSRQKIVANSLKELIENKAMSFEETSEVDANLALTDDSDESFQSESEAVTPSSKSVVKISTEIKDSSDKRVNESSLIEIDNKLITNDSEIFDTKFVDKVNDVGIIASKVPLINEQTTEITQTIGESENIYVIQLLEILEYNSKFY